MRTDFPFPGPGLSQVSHSKSRDVLNAYIVKTFLHEDLDSLFPGKTLEEKHFPRNTELYLMR